MGIVFVTSEDFNYLSWEQRAWSMLIAEHVIGLLCYAIACLADEPAEVGIQERRTQYFYQRLVNGVDDYSGEIYHENLRASTAISRTASGRERLPRFTIIADEAAIRNDTSVLQAQAVAAVAEMRSRRDQLVAQLSTIMAEGAAK